MGALRGEHTSCWLHAGGRLIQATLEQVRPAAGWETWHPTAADWENIQRLRQPAGIAATPMEDHSQPMIGMPDDVLMDAPVLSQPFDVTPHASNAGDTELERRLPGTPAPLPSMASHHNPFQLEESEETSERRQLPSSSNLPMSTRPLELLEDPSAETSRAKIPCVSDAVLVDDNEYATVPRTSDAFLVYDNEYAGYIMDDDTIGWDGSPTLTTCTAALYRDIFTANHVPPMGRRE
eukprot:1130725-Amphidinium_carterae.2